MISFKTVKRYNSLPRIKSTKGFAKNINKNVNSNSTLLNRQKIEHHLVKFIFPALKNHIVTNRFVKECVMSIKTKLHIFDPYFNASKTWSLKFFKRNFGESYRQIFKTGEIITSVQQRVVRDNLWGTSVLEYVITSKDETLTNVFITFDEEALLGIPSFAPLPANIVASYIHHSCSEECPTTTTEALSEITSFVPLPANTVASDIHHSCSEPEVCPTTTTEALLGIPSLAPLPPANTVASYIHHNCSEVHPTSTDSINSSNDIAEPANHSLVPAAHASNSEPDLYDPLLELSFEALLSSITTVDMDGNIHFDEFADFIEECILTGRDILGEYIPGMPLAPVDEPLDLRLPSVKKNLRDLKNAYTAIHTDTRTYYFNKI